MATTPQWGFGSLGSNPGSLPSPSFKTANSTPMTSGVLTRPPQPKTGMLGGADPTVSSRLEKSNGDIVEKYFDPNKNKTGVQKNVSLSVADKTPIPTPAPVPEPVVPSKPDYTTYPGMIAGATSAAQGNLSLGQKAQDIATQTGQQISDIGQRGASARGGYLSTGTSPVAEGNAAILAQTTAAQQQAAAAGGEMALKGTAQGLTAQQQTQSGMLGAAGLTPEALRYGGTAGGTLNPLNNLDSIASQVISGQISPAQARAMGGNISTWEGALNQALLAKNPQYNEAKMQGAYEATQSTSGTQTGTVESYKSALQQGQNLKAQLTDLITSFNLNPADINKANQGLQAIASNVSDPRYKILQNYVNDIANTYAQVLTPPGGSQTDTTRGLAASMLDSTMAGKGLITVMDSLDQAANAKIAGVKTQGGAGTATSGGTWNDIFGG